MASENAHPAYRPDIDGLRAVAVLAVVVFHAFPGALPGGFIGVDVFFVISGFLISTIIIGNLEVGRFTLRDFYARRVRRIFPALAVVLAACAVLGWFTLLPAEYALLGKHIAGGAGFVSNLVLLGEAGYFDTSAATKPLLHLWSLGVEEQFYIAWPLLLAFARRRNRMGTMLVLVFVASFVLNVVSLRAHPSAAFYSPLTRFWELLVGAGLAIVSARHAAVLRVRSVVANVVAILSLLAIAVASRRFDADSPFPGVDALVPTLAAAALIAVGPGTLVNRVLLSSRPMVWVGLVSYPLYLWHWPLLAFARIAVGSTPSSGVRLVAVLLSFVLAAVTYFLVERPVRIAASRRSITPLLAGAMMACFVVGVVVWRTGGFAASRGPWNVDNVAVADTQVDQFTESCRRVEVGPFTPSFDAKRDFCHESRDSALESPEIVVLGDSHAGRLYSGLREETSAPTLLLGRGSCLPLVGYDATNPGSTALFDCAPTMERLFDRAVALAPRYIIITGFFARAYDGRVLPRTSEPLSALMRATLERLAAGRSKVVLMLDVPELPFEPAACVSRPYRRSATMACEMRRATADAQLATYVGDVRAAAEGIANVTLFDPAQVLCDDRRCEGIRDHQLLYDDPHHLSRYGARLVARTLLAGL